MKLLSTVSTLALVCLAVVQANVSVQFEKGKGALDGFINFGEMMIADRAAVSGDGEVNGITPETTYTYGIYNGGSQPPHRRAVAASDPTRRSPGQSLTRRAFAEGDCPITDMFDPEGRLNPADGATYQCTNKSYQDVCAAGDLSSKFPWLVGPFKATKYYITLQDITLSLQDGASNNVVGKYFVIKANNDIVACGQIQNKN
ncbi:hypothetical protein H4R34_000517 [Dimargaris verticillata]|uniref:Uncharacterized protein n=1 Tax=Dimargaris verticillata TaxID=2761393 RepID=A0A9W8BA98_9FUNG|nr:hypothetical protein H4R34_000517 [Dimargaris verticillata]